jgi:hypothetical protein
MRSGCGPRERSSGAAAKTSPSASPAPTRRRSRDHPRFRVRHESAIAELFGGVLELCAKTGLVELGVVIVDGTRIAASAADRQTLSYEQIAREILAEAAALDGAEDELYGRLGEIAIATAIIALLVPFVQQFAEAL